MSRLPDAVLGGFDSCGQHADVSFRCICTQRKNHEGSHRTGIYDLEVNGIGYFVWEDGSPPRWNGIMKWEPKTRCEERYYTDDGREFQCVKAKVHQGKHHSFVKIRIDGSPEMVEWEGHMKKNVPSINTVAFRAFGLGLPREQSFYLLGDSMSGYRYKGPVSMNTNPPKKGGHGDGFYSYRYINELVGGIRKKRPVYGRVTPLGQGFEHHIGYRSQSLRIDEIWLSMRALHEQDDGWALWAADISEIIDDLEERYQCDVYTVIDEGDLVDQIGLKHARCDFCQVRESEDIKIFYAPTPKIFHCSRCSGFDSNNPLAYKPRR